MTAKQMTKELTIQEWWAIVNSLRYMSSTYAPEHSGVNLYDLADRLALDTVNEDIRVDVNADYEANFRPTDEQIEYATKWAKDRELDSVFVAVDFPGKVAGQWEKGQNRAPVRTMSLGVMVPRVWTSRQGALYAMENGSAGNAVFRVYSDGEVALVDEKRN